MTVIMIVFVRMTAFMIRVGFGTSATCDSPAKPPEVEIFSIELVESWDIEELCEDGFLDELRDAAVEKAAEIAEAAHP